MSSRGQGERSYLRPPQKLDPELRSRRQGRFAQASASCGRVDLVVMPPRRNRRELGEIIGERAASVSETNPFRSSRASAVQAHDLVGHQTAGIDPTRSSWSGAEIEQNRGLTSPDRAPAATAPRLPAADRQLDRAFGRPGDLPVPVQGACVHARFSDHAGSPKRLRWRSWACCLPLHRKRRRPEQVFYIAVDTVFEGKRKISPTTRTRTVLIADIMVLEREAALKPARQCAPLTGCGA